MNLGIYIVMAHRYGESCEHSYLVAWSSDFDDAKRLANEEWEERGCLKYSGVVYLAEENRMDYKEVYRKGL